MSEHIPSVLVAQVRRRAGEICEYCLMPQWSQEATFHIDHILPLAVGGPTTLSNLALACVTCSLKKAARSSARDPKTNRLTQLFNPRQSQWRDHFRWTQTWRIVGRTPTGRATVRALGMNRPAVVLIRQAWAHLGMFSPHLH
jgi:5-methylcytosine-specific restriction endonuclease McrA